MKILLAPISWIYAMIIAIRHMLYDHNILPSHKVKLPTICVGNLAVGGTGKTPHVEYIVQLLLHHGWKVAVLSRGYKRKTKGFILADSKATAKTIGDEPMQIHAKFPNLPVAVCENRTKGIQLLQQKIKEIDVVVLDDAYQHRALKCGLNILLSTYDNLYIDDHLLPYGSLRDLPSRAQKADAIVVTKCPTTMQPIDMRVVDNKLHLPVFQQLHFTTMAYPDIKQKGVPLVLCGIAQPQYLIHHVRTQYPQALVMTYNDHHLYNDKDVDAIMKRTANVDFVLTTEKDMQRLALTTLPQKLEKANKKLIVLPTSVLFRTDSNAFDRQILTYVRENNRKK